VFLPLEHLIEGNAAVGGEKLDEEFILLGFFAFVLDSGSGTFVGPAGERAAEVGGENRVRDFVRQNAVENSLARALDVHRPLAGSAALEDEARGAAGAEVWRDVGFNRVFFFKQKTAYEM